MEQNNETKALSLWQSLYKGKITKRFLVFWSLLFVYIIISCVVTINMIIGFQKYQNEILTVSKVHAYVSSFAIFSFDVVQNNFLTFRASDTSVLVTKGQNFVTSADEDLFNLIYSTDGNTSVARRFATRESLIFDSVCLMPNDECGASRSEKYTGYQAMEHGLYRAARTWFDRVYNLIKEYATLRDTTIITTTTPDALWSILDALSNDMTHGMSTLKQTFIEESVNQFKTNETIQWILVGVGILVVLSCGLCIEMIVRQQQKEVEKTIFIIRLLPWNSIKSKMLLEKYFHDREEEFNEEIEDIEEIEEELINNDDATQNESDEDKKDEGKKHV